MEVARSKAVKNLRGDGTERLCTRGASEKNNHEGL